MQILQRPGHCTLPSAHRRCRHVPICSPLCSYALGVMIVLSAPPVPHSSTSNNFCAQFCKFRALTWLLVLLPNTGVFLTCLPSVTCAPKPNCRGRVPGRPDSLAPLAAGGWSLFWRPSECFANSSLPPSFLTSRYAQHKRTHDRTDGEAHARSLKQSLKHADTHCSTSAAQTQDFGVQQKCNKNVPDSTMYSSQFNDKSTTFTDWHLN